MRGQRWHPARVILGAALGTLLAAAVPATAPAQSQPKLPVPLPVPKTSAPPSARPAAPAASPAAAEAPPSGGPRDPFEPLIKKPAPGEERKVLSGVKLVGVIWDAKNPGEIRALVETPDGLGYYLRAHEEKFGGTVVAIDRDRVKFTVREQIPGAGTRERTVELKLAKPDAQ